MLSAESLSWNFCFKAGMWPAQMPNPYGAPITLEQAKKVAAPAMAEMADDPIAEAPAAIWYVRPPKSALASLAQVGRRR